LADCKKMADGKSKTKDGKLPQCPAKDKVTKK